VPSLFSLSIRRDPHDRDAALNDFQSSEIKYTALEPPGKDPAKFLPALGKREA
jgi:hypothetical protein